jgi:excisionase family DNA binding protein
MLFSTLDTVLNSREVEMNYLTPKDLAQRYRISERQVTHLARVGYLPGSKIGKLWRFREEDLLFWEENHLSHWGKFKKEVDIMVDEIVGTPR